MKGFELQRKYHDKWLNVAVFTTYQNALDTLSHTKGIFRVVETNIYESTVTIEASEEGTY